MERNISQQERQTEQKHREEWTFVNATQINKQKEKRHKDRCKKKGQA